MRKNKLIILGIIFALSALFFAFQYSAPVSADEPLPIASIEDLQKIGVDAAYPLAGSYKLTANLDFSDGQGGFENFLPIGTVVNQDTLKVENINSFTGLFDGNGYVIENLQLIDKAYPYYHMGLFAKTDGATIKNLALSNVNVQRTNVYPDLSTNNTTLFVGGIVGEAQNTTIMTSCVTINASIGSTASVYAGGIVGKAYAGSLIENSYSRVNYQTNISGEQASEIKIGGIVGSLENSILRVCHVKGQLVSLVTSEGFITPITNSSLGGIAGYVVGMNSQIISTYADMIVFAQSENLSAETLTGGLVGKIASSIPSTPASNNLSYSGLNTKTYDSFEQQTLVLLQTFGQKNNYDDSTSNFLVLTQNNYELFQNAGVWPQYQEYCWNFESLWTFHSDSLPTLQIFNQYTIELKEEDTRVNLGENNQAEVVSLEFVSGNGTFRYGEQIQVVISIINNYDFYYSLKSVELDMNTILSFGQNDEGYSLTQLDETLIQEMSIIVESQKVYLFSYQITDSTSGDISVTLTKVGFALNVKTDNENMGLVRKRDSTMALQEFDQEVQNANTYDFFAVPLNNDYAFSTWVFVKPAQEGEDDIVVELGDYADYAQISFVFGIGGQEDITNEILNGGSLVARFTSNVTKITLALQYKNGASAPDAGYISYVLAGEAVDTNNVLSLEKGDAITLVANVNPGYEFEGWYDGDNRLLSNNVSYLFTLEEDEISIFARYSGGEMVASLTWLWITLSVIGALGLGVGIFFIIKARSGDMSYKNFY